ncbi:CHRD domain-containing protein [Belnapia sp. T6]|uniref:CHRD domain-containing protein n=1 Tax=Belnapia mucosa TaxID=2804532 RepID=A0ABS1VCR9_9PROT|nr:CHRD domain-containing protein [Belnapia mucosa]MBL6458931.1 CHRD domain-containing protein [Belnapia mucosa]
MSGSYVSLITPANNSGVLGLAQVTLDGNVLGVEVAASGLTPDEMHPFHLHGFLDDAPERLAVYSDDADGDGIVETQEGEASAYGPVLAGLTASGRAGYFLETWPDFPTADASGNLNFAQTYVLDPNDAGQAAILERVTARLEGRVLEFHGLEVAPGYGIGTPGEVAGPSGYNEQVPVAEGLLLRADAVPGLDSADFLAKASTLLAQLAPYQLSPTAEGKEPAAPENPTVASSPGDDFMALMLPSNGSGALGLASAHIDRVAATLTVDLLMTGLTPDEVHAAHIHGFADGSASLLPNFRLDADRDGFVEDKEGEPVVGPVIQALTADGSITNEEVQANFPMADAAGTLRLHETYRFDTSDPTQAALFASLDERLAGREVQVHGLLVPAIEGEGTGGEVNGEAGYKPELPVANGILLPVSPDLMALAQAIEAGQPPAASDALFA